MTRKISENLCKFSAHEKVEYSPSLQSSMSLKDLKRDAIAVTRDLKKSGLTKSCLLPPPVSMKTLTLQRVEATRPKVA